jgi:hypothetical protein
MFEFEVAKVHYRGRRLDAFEQLAIATKFGVVLSRMAMLKKEGKRKELSAFTRAITLLTGELNNDDREYVFNRAMSSVQRRQQDGQSYAPVMVNGIVAYNDIDLPQMIEILWYVLEGNKLIDFFDLPPSTSEGGEDQTS